MNIFFPDPPALNIGLFNLEPNLRDAALQIFKCIPESQIIDIDLDSLEIPKPEKIINPHIIIMKESEKRDLTCRIIRLIHTYFRTSKILLVVHAHESGPLGDFLRVGVNGIVCTEAMTKDLPIAINAVNEGRLYIDVCQSKHPISLGKLTSSEEDISEFPGDVGFLSPREKQVLLLVAKGYTNQQIADNLGVSIKSVENDKSRVKERLGLESRAEIVKFALEQGFLNPDD